VIDKKINCQWVSCYTLPFEIVSDDIKFCLAWKLIDWWFKFRSIVYNGDNLHWSEYVGWLEGM
jgi:hypothetical protein